MHEIYVENPFRSKVNTVDKETFYYFKWYRIHELHGIYRLALGIKGGTGILETPGNLIIGQLDFGDDPPSVFFFGSGNRVVGFKAKHTTLVTVTCYLFSVKSVEDVPFL